MYNPPPYRPPLTFPGAPEPDPPPRRPRGGGCIWGVAAALAALLVLQIGGLFVLFGMPGLRAQLFEPLLAPPTTLPAASERTPEPTPEPTARSQQQQAPHPPPPESPDATSDPAPAGPVLIEDDFDAPTMRWDQSLTSVVDGAYEMRVETPNYDSYGLFLGNPSVQNFDITVDVEQVAGAMDAEYGIRFHQSTPTNYLMFSISGSGYYRLVRVRDQRYESLVPWTFDSRLNRGSGATNRLQVVADGASLTASINDTQVITLDDVASEAGQLTLGLTTFDAGGLVVHFDNVRGTVEGTPVQEDFSDAEQVVMSLGGAEIRDGSYQIFAGRGVSSWQQPLPSGSSDVHNFVLDVDTALVDGSSESAAYGVMFGDGGAFDFYRLLLLPQGALMLLHSDGNGNTETIIPPLPMEVIKSGTNAENHIHLEVRGKSINIMVNGEQLPEIESPRPVEGMVGLIVTSGTDGRVQARFDNFRLEEVAQGDST